MTYIPARALPEPFLRAPRPPAYEPGPTQARVTREIGRRLAEARRLTRATQAALGAAIGVGAASVRGYERGERRIQPVRLAAAARFLGLPLAWFFREPEQD